MYLAGDKRYGFSNPLMERAVIRLFKKRMPVFYTGTFFMIE
jgi:hypothetical protein